MFGSHEKRGPDYQNYVTHNFENKVSVMLHSRLSIIDKKKYQINLWKMEMVFCHLTVKFTII